MLHKVRPQDYQMQELEGFEYFVEGEWSRVSGLAAGEGALYFLTVSKKGQC